MTNIQKIVGICIQVLSGFPFYAAVKFINFPVLKTTIFGMDIKALHQVNDILMTMGLTATVVAATLGFCMIALGSMLYNSAESLQIQTNHIMYLEDQVEEINRSLEFLKYQNLMQQPPQNIIIEQKKEG